MGLVYYFNLGPNLKRPNVQIKVYNWVLNNENENLLKLFTESRTGWMSVPSGGESPKPAAPHLQGIIKAFWRQAVPDENCTGHLQAMLSKQ